jgi:hypothetical protein
MGLFLWLLVLLAVAWGLADYQLNSRIEVPPPPTVSKPLPAKPVSPVADAPASDASSDPATDDKPAAPVSIDSAKD